MYVHCGINPSFGDVQGKFVNECGLWGVCQRCLRHLWPATWPTCVPFAKDNSSRRHWKLHSQNWCQSQQGIRITFLLLGWVAQFTILTGSLLCWMTDRSFFFVYQQSYLRLQGRGQHSNAGPHRRELPCRGFPSQLCLMTPECIPSLNTPLSNLNKDQTMVHQCSWLSTIINFFWTPLNFVNY